MKKEYSIEIAEQIKMYFEDKEFSYFFNKEDGVFSLHIFLKQQIHQLSIFIHVEESSYCVYIDSPIGANPSDSKQMARLCSFTAYANYGLRMGCFEFDCHDGALRFRNFDFCRDFRPFTAEVFQTLFIASIETMRRYLPAITDIVFGDGKGSVEKLVNDCERRSEEEMLQDLFGAAQEERQEEIPLPLSPLLHFLGGEEELDKLLQINPDLQKEENRSFSEENPELDYCKTLKEIFPDDDEKESYNTLWIKISLSCLT